MRIGRSSDPIPQVDLNCIARRRRKTGAHYQDLLLPKLVEKNRELLQEMEDCRLQVSHTLQSCLQDTGRKRYATPSQQISAFNKRSTPEIISGLPEKNWYQSNNDCVFGENVLKLNPSGEFNVHFPIRRGELNIHNNVNGSLVAVLADLKCIWEHFIEHKLNISVSDLHQYNAVLVIPAIYNRHHLKELTNLLLLKMGFNACFLGENNSQRI